MDLLDKQEWLRALLGGRRFRRQFQGRFTAVFHTLTVPESQTFTRLRKSVEDDDRDRFEIAILLESVDGRRGIEIAEADDWEMVQAVLDRYDALTQCFGPAEHLILDEMQTTFIKDIKEVCRQGLDRTFQCSEWAQLAAEAHQRGYIDYSRFDRYSIMDNQNEDFALLRAGADRQMRNDIFQVLANTCMASVDAVTGRRIEKWMDEWINRDFSWYRKTDEQMLAMAPVIMAAIGDDNERT